MRRENRLAGVPQILWDFDGGGSGSGRQAGVAGWTVLGNDTVNLAAKTTRRVRGTNCMEFDKTNGAADTKLAGAYRPVDWNLSGANNVTPYDEIGWYVYVSDTIDVDYSFIRIGTSASHYQEYQVNAYELVSGEFVFCHQQLYAYASITGNGCDFTNIGYLAIGVAFKVESDALADIAIDEICLLPSSPHATGHEIASLVVDDTAYQDAEINVISPDTDVGTTPVALVVPSGARYLHLRASAAIRFGSNATLDGTADDGYDYLPAYEPSGAIPVLNETTMYVRINAGSGTCTVWHRWETRTG
jgi:hypothetical protein